MSASRNVGFAALSLLLAAGCSGSKVDHETDAWEPVLADAAADEDAPESAFDGDVGLAGDADELPSESEDGGDTVGGGAPADAGSDSDAAAALDAGPADAGELADAAGPGLGSDAAEPGLGSDAAEPGLASDAAPVSDAASGGGGTSDDGAAPEAGGSLDGAADGASGAGDAGLACDDDNGGITLPPGFCAARFAEGLPGPRHIAITPAGDVFVASAPRSGASPSFVALRDANGDGKAEQRVNFGSAPGNGIAWHAGYLYFAAHDSVLRYALPDGSLTPSGGPELIVGGLPATPDHYAKSVAIPRSGGFMYVNIGSASNSCQVQNRALESPGIDPCPELETREGIWKFELDQPGQTLADATHVAKGTRNANALALDSADQLFTAQNSRDQLNENWPALFTLEQDMRLPAEGIFHVGLGDDYGWPYCYFDAEKAGYFLAPEYGGDGEIVGRCAGLRQPVATLPAHWAPLGAAFYEAAQFPEHYRHGLFIANHGSRFAPNAAEPLPGYNVVFIPFAEGAPSGPFERFAEGFAGPARPLPDGALHRPVGVAVAPDGALFVSDDKGGTIWRVVYRGP
jgi:glucose/arabinose dehydrogenase